MNCDFIAKTMKCNTIIIFSDNYFLLLILPYSDESIFVTITIHNNTYSDKIFRYYRLTKLVPKFPSASAHFSDHNSNEK